MPRTGRLISPEGGVYHVTCRGNNKARVFHDEEDLRAFLAIVLKCKKERPFKLYHYCPMPNHYHLQLEPDEKTVFADIMKQINQSYSLYYKKKYAFVGQLWQGRFYSRIILDEQYLTTCGIYIELNPVRGGVTKNPEDYRWSSYGAYANGETDPLVDLDPIYLAMAPTAAERQAEYRAMTRMWQLHPVEKKQAKKWF
jgi:REP element-mobilizing transposase RayT